MQAQNEGGLTDFYMVEKEMLENKGIPLAYAGDRGKVTAAVHRLTSWEFRHPNGYSDPEEQRVYELFNAALIEMCCAQRPIQVCNTSITARDAIQAVNRNTDAEFLELNTDVQSTIITNFRQAVIDGYIRKSPLGYMKSCIWNQLQEGAVSDFAV